MASDLSLDALAVRHGSDKSSRVHHYTRVYEPLFAPLRHQPIRLLEIGVGAGNSLRMWHDYFPAAKIFGLDLAQAKQFEGLDVTVFVGSQADEQTLRRVAAEAGKFDIVIDDGSHRWADQVFACRRLFPHVQPGGFYAIEDLHTSYWDQYRSGPETAVAFLQGLVDDLNLRGRSGYGEPRNDPHYATLIGTLNDFERTLESLTFVKSLVLLKKKGPADF
jgi:demethylmacrocin O-methyltransferase